MKRPRKNTNNSSWPLPRVPLAFLCNCAQSKPACDVLVLVSFPWRTSSLMFHCLASRGALLACFANGSVDAGFFFFSFVGVEPLFGGHYFNTVTPHLAGRTGISSFLKSCASTLLLELLTLASVFELLKNRTDVFFWLFRHYRNTCKKLFLH